MCDTMSYFPAFIKFDNKKVLLVGAGNIALEKLEKLLVFTKDIVIIALEFSPEILAVIKEEKLFYEKRAYKKGDIKDMSMVVVAIDDIGLQKSIYKESQDYKCLCNSVDSIEYCDFIFPSLIKNEDLTIAVSTSGSSPAFAKHFRIYLEGLIPDGINTFLEEMRELRASLPKGKERMKMLDTKAKEYIRGWKE